MHASGSQVRGVLQYRSHGGLGSSPVHHYYRQQIRKLACVRTEDSTLHLNHQNKQRRRHTEEKRCKFPRVATGGCERQRHLGIEWIYALMGDIVRLHWHQYALHVLLGSSTCLVMLSSPLCPFCPQPTGSPLPSQYRILIDRPLSAVCQENSRRASIDN